MIKNKTLLFLLLSVCMSMVTANTWAYDAKIDGIYYNFSGTEASVTYYSMGQKENCQAYQGSIVIPESVTYNGQTYRVTSIGEDAFYYCSELTSITIPNSVKTIGKGAFQNCGLTTITIPDGVTSIGREAFYHCYELTSASIPNSVEAIGSSAFTQCSDLTSVTFGNGLKSIGSNAFVHCKLLASITIPNSVVSIDGYSFHNTAWYNSQPDGLVYLNDVLYDYKGDKKAITSITVKEGTRGIAGSVFSGCENLTSVTIPSSVKFIGSQTFEGCI